MNRNKIKIFVVSLFSGLLLLGPALAFAQTYSSYNDCESNTGADSAACCQLFPTAPQCASNSGTQIPNGSPCVTSAACQSGNCSAGLCASSAGVTGTQNLNGGNSGNSSGGNSGSGVICDTSNGYTMQNGLCIPNSPFSGGLASQSTLSGLITTILNIVLLLAGIIAVVFIIIGGYRYMTAGGNEENAEKGRKALVNAIIGLVIIILAFTIVQVVTNALTSGSPLGK